MAKVCTFSLDEETVKRLEWLVEHSPKTTKSSLLRDLIDKEFVLRSELRYV
jgi:predicted DNA-binding protein